MMIQAKRCLVIPDVHQNTAWVQRILRRETSWDKAVFLGDYFDTRVPRKKRTGVGATCDYLGILCGELGDRAVFLLGNHDIQYLEAKPACDHYRTPRNLNYKCGSAYTHSAAAKIAKSLPMGFWLKARLFVGVNGWLLSHAGLSPRLWPQGTKNDEMTLAALDEQATSAVLNMKKGPHPLLQIGRARGGEAEVGGLTWLDWDEEFSDIGPYPQIVGHTPSAEGARRKGRSWCLDGQQTCYGVMENCALTVEIA